MSPLPILCVILILIKNFTLKNKISRSANQWLSASLMLLLIPQLMVTQSGLLQYKWFNLAILAMFWLYSTYKFMNSRRAHQAQ